jgi:hypothetical protein
MKLISPLFRISQERIIAEIWPSTSCEQDCLLNVFLGLVFVEVLLGPTNTVTVLEIVLKTSRICWLEPLGPVYCSKQLGSVYPSSVGYVSAGGGDGGRGRGRGRGRGDFGGRGHAPSSEPVLHPETAA